MIGILVISTLAGMCSTHWVIVWVALEVNTLAMCFSIASENNINNESDSATFLYYLIQVFASLLIVLSASQLDNSVATLVLTVSVLINIGAWPLHLWYINLIESISLNETSIIIVITWQNILPLVLLNVTKTSPTVTVIVALLATASLLAPMPNLNPQSSVNSVLGLSSLNNNGWLLVASTCSTTLFFVFLALYSASLNVALNFFNSINTNSINTQVMFWAPLAVVCNLGGIPPLTMFWGNIIVVNTIIQSSIPTEIAILIVMVACLLLYNYMWIPLNETTKTPVNSQIAWNPQSMSTVLLLPLTSAAGFLAMLTLDLSQGGLSW